MSLENEKTLKQKNRKILFRLVVVAVGMIGFSFALVPLYNVFCSVTGINGKTGGQTTASASMQEDDSRDISIEFIAMNGKEGELEFRPRNNRMELHPGKIYSTEFYVKNLTNKAVVLQAVPSISPGSVALMLHKTECFCFTQQPLAAGEEKWMPVHFFLDSEFPKDIQKMTLQYTLYDITGKGESGKVVSN